MGLRLMVYDRTFVGGRIQPLLTSSWIAGALLYEGLRRLDASYGATSWEDALAWLCSVEPRDTIDEVQYWGHGRWGRVQIAKDVLDVDALRPGHSRYADLCALRDRLSGPDALVWFRSCETFGREAGQRFASTCTSFFGCRAAGHTYVIGPLQSGLHSLRPGERPAWSTTEGLPTDADRPAHALMSHAGAPNTITCLHGAVPAGW